MRQIGEAISWLHSQGVCHRDLKPENLLLSEDGVTVKICDFGLCVALGEDGTLAERQGTWAYWAPEMFKTARYGKEVDLWSLGESSTSSSPADTPLTLPAALTRRCGRASRAAR